MTGKYPMEIPIRKPFKEQEPPVPPIYPVLDTDLARDNLENDIPAADLTELRAENRPHG